ncbi:MAG: HIT domain-containing protein [Patescibacteria group bacterium]|nr:HIT domain-containing protein [Patescibacteria group bacterium]
MKPIDDKNKYDFYCEEVLSGKIKVEAIYESENIIAYYHTKPFYDLHIVVVPKEHISDLTYIDDKHKDLIWEITQTAKDIIKKFLPKWKGIGLITNFGDYQDSLHLHFYIGVREYF